jgi:hypothetical protein
LGFIEAKAAAGMTFDLGMEEEGGRRARRRKKEEEATHGLLLRPRLLLE